MLTLSSNVLFSFIREYLFIYLHAYKRLSYATKELKKRKYLFQKGTKRDNLGEQRLKNDSGIVVILEKRMGKILLEKSHGQSVLE